MTQLTFDFTATSTASTFAPGSSTAVSPARPSKPQADDFPARQPAAPRPARLHGSLPLHEPGQGEIHHMGDLAQLVLARYDIVHRRRQARLAREAARRRGA